MMSETRSPAGRGAASPKREPVRGASDREMGRLGTSVSGKIVVPRPARAPSQARRHRRSSRGGSRHDRGRGRSRGTPPLSPRGRKTSRASWRARRRRSRHSTVGLGARRVKCGVGASVRGKYGRRAGDRPGSGSTKARGLARKSGPEGAGSRQRPPARRAANWYKRRPSWVKQWGSPAPGPVGTSGRPARREREAGPGLRCRTGVFPPSTLRGWSKTGPSPLGEPHQIMSF